MQLKVRWYIVYLYILLRASIRYTCMLHTGTIAIAKSTDYYKMPLVLLAMQVDCLPFVYYGSLLAN